MSIPIKISGSCAAAILGQSPYQTPVNVWLQIMGRDFCKENNYEYPEFEGNAATRWGSAFESAIVELTEQVTNKDIADREKYFEKDYLTCHIDGIIDGALYEAKTTTAFSFKDEWGEPGSDRIPVNYQLQIQHNLMLTGLSEALLSVLVFPRRVEEWEEMGWRAEQPEMFEGDWMLIKNIDGQDCYRNPKRWAPILEEMGYFHQYHIPAHPQLQQAMIAAYSDWWERHVIGKTEPEAATYDDIRALCREPVGTIVCTDEIERLKAEYDSIGEEISASGALAKRREQIKVNVLSWARTAGHALDDESQDKFVFRTQDGKKVASYGKNKNGVYSFR